MAKQKEPIVEKEVRYHINVNGIFLSLTEEEANIIQERLDRLIDNFD